MPLPSPAITRRSWLPNRERTRYWLGRIGRFGAWQLASQAIQLITGFLLVRWLSLEAYAQYGVALGFQNMLNMLVDLGFSLQVPRPSHPKAADPATQTRWKKTYARG